MKVLLTPMSHFGLAILMCAKALKAPMEVIIHYAQGPHSPPEYLALNPSGKIPTLVDGDFSLSEHVAINKYLSLKYRAFYPKDIKEQATVDQWCLFITNHLSGEGIYPALVNKVYPLLQESEPNISVLKEAIKNIHRYLKVIDDQLAKTAAYLAGDGLTIADFSLAASTAPMELLKISVDPYPHLQKWRESIQGEDFYQKAFAVHQAGSYTEIFKNQLK